MLGIKIVHLIEMSFVLAAGLQIAKVGCESGLANCKWHCLWVMYAVYWTILDNNRASENGFYILPVAGFIFFEAELD